MWTPHHDADIGHCSPPPSSLLARPRPAHSLPGTSPSSPWHPIPSYTALTIGLLLLPGSWSALSVVGVVCCVGCVCPLPSASRDGALSADAEAHTHRHTELCKFSCSQPVPVRTKLLATASHPPPLRLPNREAGLNPRPGKPHLDTTGRPPTWTPPAVPVSVKWSTATACGLQRSLAMLQRPRKSSSKHHAQSWSAPARLDCGWTC